MASLDDLNLIEVPVSKDERIINRGILDRKLNETPKDLNLGTQAVALMQPY
jgi:hypothetical protein